MSEERLVAIEGRIGAVETRLGGVEHQLDQLRAGQTELRAGHDELRNGLNEVRAGLANLDHNMRVLHEDVIARIAALAPDFAPIRREFRQADAELRDEIDRRLTPLEAAARGRRGPRRG